MIQSMLQSFEDPHSRHAVLVHFPIVLGALGLVPAIALACRKFASIPISIVCIAWFAAAMAGLGLASNAGEAAYERVEDSPPPLTTAQHDALEEHESLGEGAWLWAIPAVALSAATLVPRKPVRIVSGVLLIGAAGTLAGFVTVAGHTGGTLVYTHGLGVPQRASAGPAALPQAPRLDEDDDH